MAVPSATIVAAAVVDSFVVDDVATAVELEFAARFQHGFQRVAKCIQKIVSRDVKQQTPELRLEPMTAQAAHGQTVFQFIVTLFHLRDLTDSHRDEHFFSTAVRTSAKRVVEAFIGHWDIEFTFAEMREHLNLETTRGPCHNAVLRVNPCLSCLYAPVVYRFDHLPERNRETIHVD